MAFVETMKPRERVLNALTGKPVDRTPVADGTVCLHAEHRPSPRTIISLQASSSVVQ